MRVTRHNGRSGKHGVYNPKHNDRKFDIANSEHIDAEREKQNIYWDCYRGYVQNPSDETLRNWGPVEPEASFHDIEKMYYEDHYKLLRGADFEKKGAVDDNLRVQRFNTLKEKLPDVLDVHSWPL